ncbi:flagellar assembly protein FliW [Desulfovibrio mangrovi]|uniref:flagellar assembly protein FliW n=1 Tax=Desulfovibrio mangrovi TaxID=2976983 RepID=UPI002246D563|nr:flagellar assembly protein FliW [Desulfovibrio mangrovi]UZP67012.1 flagellar assembly protein FliW [Desulfovibrio mangrovi]
MARQNEKIVQTRLGKQVVSMDKIIYFPRGLMGFEDKHEFTLLQLKEGSPFLVLQSLDDPRLGLLVADPYSFLEDYPIRVSEAEQKLLRLENIRQVAVLVTVSIPKGEPEKTALNLTGPILINHKARLGLQVPQVDGKFPNQVYLHMPQE